MRTKVAKKSGTSSQAKRFIVSLVSLLRLIPINADVLSRPTDGDEVDTAVAVDVGRREVFDRDAPLFDDLPRPFAANLVHRTVDADAAANLAAVVADANDDFVGPIAVEVCHRHGMAPFQLVVNHVTIPHGARLSRLCVDHDLETMPRLHGGDELLAILQNALLDFARPRASFGIVLIARADLARGPFAVVFRDQANAFVARSQNVLPLACAGNTDEI